jgi:restriction system protein
VSLLEALLANRRYRLAQYDWRSLRGTPFEDFLAEVFTELGYSVQKTKVTGDQGVDLILSGKRSRIAVQTKGYAESVGNGAIQEAYAGMAFYECDRCVAVTNSSFTAAARELAEKVGCVLIDGHMIPELIKGRIL